MKRVLVSLLLCTALLSGCGTAVETGKVVESVIIETSNFDRAANLLDEAYDSTRGKNVLISPVSLDIGLSLLADGAKTGTKTELVNYLGSESYSEDVSTYIGKANSTDGITLANSVWVNRSAELIESYRNNTKTLYKAEVRDLNFDSAYLDNAIKEINNWSKDKTSGLIPNIVSRDNIGSNTSVVLVNSLYFKSSWMEELKVKQSKFKDINGKEILTDMVYGKADFYCENTNVKAFGLNYANGIKFIGILPNSDDKFNASDLDLDTLFDYRTTNYDVSFMMPKLNFDYTMGNCVNALVKEGVTSVFDANKSDLSGMLKSVPGNNHYVSNIVQRCKINLDEFGTEAAAITAITVSNNSISSVEKKTKKIDLDRPYLFMIYDDVNEQILFMGKVVTID